MGSVCVRDGQSQSPLDTASVGVHLSLLGGCGTKLPPSDDHHGDHHVRSVGDILSPEVRVWCLHLD